MRKRFTVEMELGQKPIEEVEITIKSRDELPPTLRALQWIFKNEDIRDQILEILEKKVICGKKQTGRTGMELWQILVLGVTRLSLDCNYDRLEYLAHYDMLVRQMMGLPKRLGEGEEFGKKFHQKTISDNVKHIDEEMLKQINEIVAKAGSTLLLKKNEKNELKSDSYVLESNVHFPTDYNLLWDAGRKSIILAERLCKKYKEQGWRKCKDWEKRLKSIMRSCGRIQRGGGKNKEERIKRIKSKTKEYLKIASELDRKVRDITEKLNKKIMNRMDEEAFIELQYFHYMLVKHINLIERRVIRGEIIPHEEKVFSLFEPHTEWINKGKSHPQVELGHKILLTTNQYSLIVDYKVMSQSIDAKEVKELKERVLKKLDEEIASMSFDKGFSTRENMELLDTTIFEVMMQKKGRLNLDDKAREATRRFKELKNRHNAVESDINCLEHHGLNRCPDKGLKGYVRYVGLGILAYNLHKIGNYLQQKKRQEYMQKQKMRIKQAA
ncbi:ISNCY family transposase [bacterium]